MSRLGLGLALLGLLVSAAPAAALPATWCGTPPALGTLDAPGADWTNAPHHKVLYAVPKGTPASQLTLQRATDLQAALQLARERVLTDSAASPRSLRFDLAQRSCDAPGPQLDIGFLELPRTESAYEDADDLADMVMDDLKPILDAARGDRERDWMVFAEMPFVAHSGLGLLYQDTEPSPNRNLNAGPGAIALAVYGPAHVNNRVSLGRLALHEIAHTLGAVMDGAPKSTPGNHCTDGFDVMCYDDDGPGPVPDPEEICPENVAGIDAFDCGGDNYFNVAPAPGSWLAGNWNTANSPFLCPDALCESVAQPPPVPDIASSVPDAAVARVVLSTTSTAPKLRWKVVSNGYFAAPDGDLGQTVTVDVADRYAPVVVRVRAIAADGSFTEAERSISMPPLPPPPPTPPPQPPPTTAPKKALTIRGSLTRSLKTVLRSGVRLPLSYSGAVTPVRVRLRIDAKGQRKLKLKSRVLATRRIVLTTGNATLVMRPGKTVLRRLRKLRGTVTLTLDVPGVTVTRGTLKLTTGRVARGRPARVAALCVIE